MNGERQISLLPVACCMPWAFLVLYLNLLHSNILWAVVMLLCAVLLGLWLRRDGSIPVLLLGNGISLFFSCLLVNVFREPNWNISFKPLGTVGTAVALQGCCIMLQYVVFQWKKERSTVQNFFLALSVAALLLGSFVYGFLCIQAARIGAI